MNLDLRLYQLMQEEIGNHHEKHAAEIITGRPTDWADYRYRVGILKGLRDALVIAEEANRRAIGLEEKTERS
jgi:hypothetical protein